MQVSYLIWIFAVASSLAAVQLVYSLQFAVGVEFFRDTFKIPSNIANVILAIPGPVCGFLVQPIVGAFSDNSTSQFGRRRPYILAGTLLTACGMALLACSEKLGVLFGDKTEGLEAKDHIGGIIVSMVGLVIMNLFTNVMQGPSRALVNDIVDPAYVQTGNAIATAVMALAAIAGNIIGALTSNLDQKFFILLLIGAGAIVLVSLPTLFFAKEQQRVLQEGEEVKTVGGVFKDIYKGFRYMPKELGFVALLYFFSWCAYTPQMINMTPYIRNNLFHDYETGATLGLSWAYYTGAIFAGVQFLYSLVQPAFLKIMSPKFLYLITQLIAGGCFVSVLFLQPWPAASIALLVVVAMNFAAFNSIPFALVSKITAGSNGGLYLGVLNSAAVISQLIVTNAVVVPVLGAVAPLADGVQNVSWGIFIGGPFSAVAIIWGLLCVSAPKESDAEKQPLIQHAE